MVWLCFCILFLLSLIYTITLQLTYLWDLEDDYINEFDFASQIKSAFMAEFIVQGLLCFLYRITGYWFLTLLSVPYLYYNLTLYMRREHLIDVTEIFDLLNWKEKETRWKFAHTLFLLFTSVFWLIWRSLDADQHTLHMVARLSSEALADL